MNSSGNMTASDSQKVLVVSHDACLQHAPHPSHPEHPARLQTVRDSLSSLESLSWVEAPEATHQMLTRVHSARLVDQLFDLSPTEGTVQIDPDTGLSAGSIEAATRAAGAVCRAIDEVLAGHYPTAFCAVRPPGHHAEPDQAMGFCLFNNIAVGARHALESHALDRVAIIDFDVHHGNGTQAAFASESQVLFVSTHQSPLYPGTGMANETGVGNILNIPMAAGTRGPEYRRQFDSQVIPRVLAFRPQLVLVSAGFDGHTLDPLANMALETDDYRWITRQLVAAAKTCCDGRVVSTLEGGYHLPALGDSVTAHVEALRQ